ncbi:hypothetical protein C0W88_09155 [Photobacterium leiognathi subsp. mandapamensis]|uniref:glycosyltransferase n=1 Tax=Photobacterium leiognathi TaxID=553611 RepID=UPI000D17A0E0|nr:glycosyltransferase [Photobacterium leiognathi]PSW65237.1 hypothetical protein C0W88_09155 [Photobacterium leiognathi subsp. mandapamensis]
MKIYFYKNKKSFLPEIDAYVNYFKRNHIDAEVTSRINCISKGDIIWYFMGFNLKRKKNVYVVHEYASLSVGKLPKLKNKIKRIINCKPDLRIFLNEYIKDEFNFTDNVPYVIRDMAVSKEFINFNNKKKYDYVYCGKVDSDRRLDLILEQFRHRKDKNILVIGNVPDAYIRQFSDLSNITFIGNVSNSKVPFYLNQAKIGINIINNIYPYTKQTSTKILEYLACGLFIYTTRTEWCISYEMKHQLTFQYIEGGKIEFDALFERENEYQPKYWDDILNNIDIVSKIRGITNE